MPDPIEVRKIPLLSVSDASGLAALVDTGVLDADRVLAVIGKTEGTAGSTTTPGSSPTARSARCSWRRAPGRRSRSARCRSCGPVAPTAC